MKEVSEIRYRGRTIRKEDIESIRRLIAEHPGASRRRLSEELCRAWNWRQENGELRAMVARGLMLLLERSGYIKLPPVRWRNPNPFLERRKPPRLPFLVWPPVEGRVAEIRPLDIRQVRRSGEEELFDGLLETHHYLGYTQPVGEHLKYMVSGRGTPLALMAWSSAPRHLGPRDRYLGWSKEARRRNLRFLAYNTRFLILPWVKVPHLASHLLSVVARQISEDWEALYRHPIYFLETFVDPERFRGTCYLGANWIRLGLTTGRGKDDQAHKPNRPLKEVLGYPLSKNFREKLSMP